ncbi:MAG: hypothetical protein AABZ06_10730, partial [Bdellovibrionota bacterium]
IEISGDKTSGDTCNLVSELPNIREFQGHVLFALNQWLQNKSGLKLQYIFKNGERTLEVTGIAKKSPAGALAKHGLKPGMCISKINSIPAEDMDFWEMEKHLAGAYGTTVSIRWQAAGKNQPSFKEAPLNLLVNLLALP